MEDNKLGNTSTKRECTEILHTAPSSALTVLSGGICCCCCTNPPGVNRKTRPYRTNSRRKMSGERSVSRVFEQGEGGAGGWNALKGREGFENGDGSCQT